MAYLRNKKRLSNWISSQPKFEFQGLFLQQRGGCYMRRAKHNFPSSTKALGSFL